MSEPEAVRQKLIAAVVGEIQKFTAQQLVLIQQKGYRLTLYCDLENSFVDAKISDSFAEAIDHLESARRCVENLIEKQLERIADALEGRKEK